MKIQGLDKITVTNGIDKYNGVVIGIKSTSIDTIYYIEPRGVLFQSLRNHSKVKVISLNDIQNGKTEVLIHKTYKAT